MQTSVNQVINIFSAIVVVAGLTVVFKSPETKGIITATMGGFANSVKAAQGR